MDTTQVAHAIPAAGLFDDAAMQIENLGQREITHQLSRR